ncbi:MAG: tetratricopeptide repeat-containing sensor histidine kinase [Bacteroidales bacterium]|nr:tetratricopeptide repeat-containing sensor histidine kinase [Bacteroidales bacterium]MBN2817434.1 tetratricopeptide repeat-containing sensor histidine kinase [Bacteroidales bacterium]
MPKLTSISVVFLLFACTLLFAGWHETIDSLQKELGFAKTDSAKIRLLTDLGNEVISNSPELAIKYYNEAYSLSEIIKDTSLLVNSLLGICSVYTMTGEYSLAMETVYQALQLVTDNKELKSKCYSRLAAVQYFLEDYEESLKYDRKALLLDIELGDSARIATDYHNIGIYFLETDEFDSALYYLYMAHYMALKREGKPDSYNLSHLGHTYTYMERYDSALYYHAQAFYYDSINDLGYEMAIDDYYIAFTYYNNKQYEKAVFYSERSLKRAKEMKLFELMLFNYEMLYELYEERELFKDALQYALIRNDYADSLRDKSKQSLVQSLEAKYKFEEQKQNLEIAEAENKLLSKQRRLFVILSIVSILFLISTIVIIFLVIRKSKANQVLLKEIARANSSKEKLISVISHDLRSSIGTLRNAVMYTLDDSLDFDSVKSMMQSFYPVVDSTYDLLENLLTWAHYNRENLEPFFEKLDIREISEQAIKHIGHIADNKGIKIINQIESGEISADKNMIQIVFRNLISNALKFSNAQTKIILKSCFTSRLIEIQVVDEGIGIPSNVVDKLFYDPVDFHTKGTKGERGSGLGLSLCKTFIEKHGGKIWLRSLESHGSTFYFTLPLRQ